MSQSKGIRAGKAYVELGANDSALTKGLRAAQAKLKSFGKGLAIAGSATAAAGSAVLGPMLAATSVFAASGDELSKAADKTGASVESLSELRHAASQSAVSFKMLGSGMNKAQRNLAEAASGNATAAEAFSNLGLSVDELMQLKPDQQFSAIADRISQIENPAERTAAAMDVFGKSGAEMMPLMLGGAKGIDALRAEARALGLQVSGKDAAAATLLGDTWANVQLTLKSVVFQIGAALAPALTDVLKKITPLIVASAKWISKNRNLVVMVAAIAAGVVAAGSALIGLGGVFTLLSIGIGGVISAIGAVTAVFAFIASPIGIAIAAVAALAAGFFYLTDVGSSVISWFQTGFANLLNIVTGTVGGIYNAISAGRLDLAAEIAMTGVKLVFATVMESILGIFGSSIDGMMQMLAGLYKRIEQVMSRLAALQQKAINAASSAIAAIGFGSEEDERGRRLEAKRKRLLESQGKAYTANDTSLAANLADIQNDDTAAANGRITDADNIDTDALGKSWADELDPDSLRKKLDELNATAAAAKAATEAQAAAAPGALDTSLLADLRGGAMQAKAVQGTFSARAATQLGSGNWQDRVAKGIDKIVKNTDPKNNKPLVATA